MNEQINDKLWEKAERFANREYRTEITEEELTSGEKIYIAKNPELRGCMAQGTSHEAALKELTEVRTNYIYFLLVDGLDVPYPGVAHTTEGTGIFSQVSFKTIAVTGVVSSGELVDDESMDPIVSLSPNDKRIRFGQVGKSYA